MKVVGANPIRPWCLSIGKESYRVAICSSGFARR
nr:MAG TPA: hypothetical protein [Caudoviricetes sp.]